MIAIATIIANWLYEYEHFKPTYEYECNGVATYCILIHTNTANSSYEGRGEAYTAHSARFFGAECFFRPQAPEQRTTVEHWRDQR